MAASDAARSSAATGSCNDTIAESLALATDVRNGVAPLRDVEVAVAPGFTALHAVAKRLEDGPVAVAAQDCFWEDKGAFTGEVSAPQLVDVGCKYVIIGHSERRQLFGETDAAVNMKVRAALRAGLRPIVCVGETLAERDAGETFGRVQAQLDAALRRHRRRRRWRARHRLRAGVGHRHRPHRDAGAGAGGARFIRSRIAGARSRRWRRACASCTAAASSPTTPRAHGPGGHRRRPGGRRVAVKRNRLRSKHREV